MIAAYGAAILFDIIREKKSTITKAVIQENRIHDYYWSSLDLRNGRISIVLPLARDDDPAELAARVLASVEHSTALIQNDPTGSVTTVTLSISVGVTVTSDSTMAAKEIESWGEAALEIARRTGSGQISVIDLDADSKYDFENDMDTTSWVRQAVREERHSVVYEPIVCTKGGHIEYYECLSRIYDDRRQCIVEPADFIPALERIGAISFLDFRMLEFALNALKQDPHITLGVNVSGLSVGSRISTSSMLRILNEHSGVASRLIIEITETVPFLDFEEVAQFVRTIKSIGCRVALDDFGVGFTSVKHLHDLALDIVKVDRAYVPVNIDDTAKLDVLGQIISLIHGAGAGACVEGIESGDQMRAVLSAGADYIQGYYFGLSAFAEPWTEGESESPLLIGLEATVGKK